MADWAEVVAVGRARGLVRVQAQIRSVDSGRQFRRDGYEPGRLPIGAVSAVAVIRKQHPTHLLGWGRGRQDG
jgi:hypothetical protein